MEGSPKAKKDIVLSRLCQLWRHSKCRYLPENILHLQIYTNTVKPFHRLLDSQESWIYLYGLFIILADISHPGFSAEHAQLYYSNSSPFDSDWATSTHRSRKLLSLQEYPGQILTERCRAFLVFTSQFELSLCQENWMLNVKWCICWKYIFSQT